MCIRDRVCLDLAAFRNNTPVPHLGGILNSKIITEKHKIGENHETQLSIGEMKQEGRAWSGRLSRHTEEPRVFISRLQKHLRC